MREPNLGVLLEYILPLLNPLYQFSFTVNNEKYLMDIESRIVIDMNDKYNCIKFAPETKFNILVHKVKPNNMLSFEDQKEFKTMEEVAGYIESWKEKAGSA